MIALRNRHYPVVYCDQHEEVKGSLSQKTKDYCGPLVILNIPH